ncbi:pupal cuticle protein 36-like [Penaeus japonicus]|uniref:pupal cuticle protein 36-like n=1 Tax=Penaeus japonicus TaxID=27405 RepID=UPI001C70EC79|nr:pupal cuticle protein 36-like [Penaeus japonicus]
MLRWSLGSQVLDKWRLELIPVSWVRGKGYINDEAYRKDTHITQSASNMKCLTIFCILGLSAASRLQSYSLPGSGSGGFSHGSSGQVFDHGSTSFGQGVSSGSSFGSTSGTSFSHGGSSGSSFGFGSSGSSFGSGFSSGSSFGSGSSSGSSFGFGSSGATSQGPCGGGQVRHVDGRCVTPRVNRRVFVYDVPANVQTSGPVNIPEPRVETNILLIRTPEGGLGPQPVVIPPPRQNNVVYVLNKQSSQDQRVIEVPSSGSATPEVYFVNYAEGENPTLPSGVDLQTALQTASQGSGQEIGSAGHSISGGGQTVISSGQSFGSGISSGSFDSQVIGSGISSGSFGGQVVGSGISFGSFDGHSTSGGSSSFVSQPSGLYTTP